VGFGGEVATGPCRILDKDAAVGLLKRSAALLLSEVFLTGGGGWGGAFRDLAREAAVGAYRPDDGVFGRAVEGVFGRERDEAVRDGVWARAGVMGVFVTSLREIEGVAVGLEEALGFVADAAALVGVDFGVAFAAGF
jgi:hypothetical protein